MNKLFWACVVTAVLYLVMKGEKTATVHPNTTYVLPSPVTTPYSPPNQRFYSASAATDLSDTDDGEFECTVENQSRLNGPYTLTCEKDGDDLRINFPNGGHIITGTDGFHASSAEQWNIESNEPKNSDEADE